MKDVDVLARTIFGEARGETVSGMEAVASVVMNRLAFPAAAGVTGGEIRLSTFVKVPDSFPVGIATTPIINHSFGCGKRHRFAVCKRIAQRAVSGMLGDNTNGATHYHTRNVRPRWSVGKIPCAEIGAHFFITILRRVK